MPGSAGRFVNTQPMDPTRGKNLTLVSQASAYRSYDALFKELIEAPTNAPADNGVVSLLVQRPDTNEREIVKEATFSATSGMEGSGWKERPERGKIDQICVMSVESIRAITGGDDVNTWAAAGDQIFMDLDLSKRNLANGDRVVLGKDNGVVLEVTEKPHNGCSKFSKRFGADALKLVNCPQGKFKRLRGIYFCVLRDGVVKEGDRIRKVSSASMS